MDTGDNSAEQKISGFLREYENLQLMGITLHGRRLCLVGEKYLPIVPDATQESDTLCLIRGNVNPCVLREKESTGGDSENGRRSWTVIGGNCQLWDPKDPDTKQSLWWDFLSEDLKYGVPEEWDKIKDKLGDPDEFLIE